MRAKTQRDRSEEEVRDIENEEAEARWTVCGNPTHGIVSPTEVALFIMRHFRRRAGTRRRSCLQNIYPPRECTLP